MAKFDYLKLKELRKQKGLTQAELAKKAEIGVASLIRYEKGERTPNLGTLQRLIDILEANDNDFIIPSEEEKKRGFTTFKANYTLSEKESYIFSKYLALNEIGTKKVNDYIMDIFYNSNYRLNPEAFDDDQTTDIANIDYLKKNKPI